MTILVKKVPGLECLHNGKLSQKLSIWCIIMSLLSDTPGQAVTVGSKVRSYCVEICEEIVKGDSNHYIFFGQQWTGLFVFPALLTLQQRFQTAQPSTKFHSHQSPFFFCKFIYFFCEVHMAHNLFAVFAVSCSIPLVLSPCWPSGAQVLLPAWQ